MTKYLTDNDRKEIWANMKAWVSSQIDGLFAGRMPSSGSISIEDTAELSEEDVKNVMFLVFGKS